MEPIQPANPQANLAEIVNLAEIADSWKTDLVNRSMAMHEARQKYLAENGLVGVNAEDLVYGYRDLYAPELNVPVALVDRRPNRRASRATAMTLAFGGLLAACSGAAHANHNAATTSTSGVEIHVDPQLINHDADLQAAIQGGLQEETDASLSHGGYNCGHTIEGTDMDHYDYSNQIDFLNTTDNLGQHVLDFQVNDPTYGVGQDAWDILMTKGYDNSDTPADKQIDAAKDDANGDLDTFAHKIHTLTLKGDQDFLNFTCTNAKGEQVPIHAASLIRIKVTNHVNGIVLNDADFGDFMAKVKRYSDGTPVVRTFDAGTKDINGQQVHLNFVSLESTGCDNANRAIPPSVTIETTTSVPNTTESSTPQTTQGTTPRTTVPRSSTTSTPPTTSVPKHDDGSQPGPNGTPGTTQPAPKGPPVTDKGKNPVGGTTTTSTTAPRRTTTTMQAEPSTTETSSPPPPNP